MINTWYNIQVTGREVTYTELVHKKQNIRKIFIIVYLVFLFTQAVHAETIEYVREDGKILDTTEVSTIDINSQQNVVLGELEGVEDEVRLIKQLFPEETKFMIAIFKCESGLRQFNENGDVLISRTSDRGIAQINHIWDDTAVELGHDIDTLKGNLEMARYIYEVQGINAWVCYTEGYYKKHF